MAKNNGATFRTSFIITLIGLLAFVVFAFLERNAREKKVRSLLRTAVNQTDSIRIFQDVLRGNEYLWHGDLDSAMAIYNRYDSIDWVKEIINKRMLLLDSFRKNKTIIKEQVLVAVSNEGKVDVPAETEALIETLNREVELSKGARDSLERVALREREELMKRMNEMERSSEWKYLKFFKKTKGMYVNYVGQVKDGKANGRGVGIYSSGSVYRGDWRNDLRHGEGIFEWSDGEKYEGEYHEDMRHGFGVYYWSNGLRYVGQWQNDKREGMGTLYDKNNKIVAEGTWKNDKVVKK
ncbi:MAG TPA: hypothetical protein VK907_09045 [Phnomibacter sp.]|nr:hypothetical protein [Phnomibacter sp.]